MTLFKIKYFELDVRKLRHYVKIGAILSNHENKDRSRDHKCNESVSLILILYSRTRLCRYDSKSYITVLPSFCFDDEIAENFKLNSRKI